jgi:hypothetical protein
MEVCFGIVTWNLCTDSKFALVPTGAMGTLYLVGRIQDLPMDGELYPEFPRKNKRQSLQAPAVSSCTWIAYSEREPSSKHLT